MHSILPACRASQRACIGPTSLIKWHINDGEEVFVVLDGRVDMRYKNNGQEQSVVLEVGDIFYASIGTEHVAHPLGAARILVVEQEGSV